MGGKEDRIINRNKSKIVEIETAEIEECLYVLRRSEIVCPTNHPFDLFQSSQGARQNPLNHSKDGSSPESKQHSSILCVPKAEL